MYSKETKRRECLNDVIIFNPADQQWTEIHPEGAHFDPRRYLSVCAIGRQLLVYGGINGSQKYASDLLVLNLTKPSDRPEDQTTNGYRWMKMRPSGEGPGKLAYHACQLVLHPDRFRGPISLASLPDIRGYRTHKALLRILPRIG